MAYLPRNSRISAADGSCGGAALLGFYLFMERKFFRGKDQKALTECRVFCHKTACVAGGPAVLVIKPGNHAKLIAFFMGIMNHLHKFFAEIGKVHAGTAVNMAPPMPIFFKAFKVRSTSSLTPCSSMPRKAFRGIRWSGSERVWDQGKKSGFSCITSRYSFRKIVAFF